MKTHLTQSIIKVVRRAGVCLLAICLLFSAPLAARAEDGLFSLGSCSDSVQRVETRLCDLGYLKSVVNGRWDQADADAYAAFATANGVTPAAAQDILFTNSAIAATQHGGTVFASGAQGFPITFGSLMPWDEVAAKLVPGASYNLTSCYSGITLHMVCVSVGNHAKMKPELDWDNATLRGFFNSSSSSEKQPVLLTIDGVLVAASIQQAAPDMMGEALPEYGIYFHDSLTGINGIPDAEHEAIVKIAANVQ